MLQLKKATAVVAFVSIALSTGCATGLNSTQEREYAAFEQDRVLIVEKDPSTGIALGFLPGGGSFYARKPGVGIVNLLMWPLSILWDPISGRDGSMAINYDMTKHRLRKEMQKEINQLDEQLTLGQLDNKEYILAKRKIEQRYNYD